MSYTTAMMKKHIKFIIGVIFSIILLTLCESWLFSDYEINWLEPINDQPDFDDFEHFDWNGDVRARRSEREFFESHKEPWVHSQRCDACRLIAGKFHFAFELAESKLGIQTHNFEEYEELADEDIEEVTRQVCSKVTYKYVRPIKLRNIERLATRGLETMYYLNLPQSSSESITTITWPRRMRNHCKHLVKNMIGRELYDMWLKTSVGEGQSHGKGFEEFMCFGEGLHADCVDRERVIDENGQPFWPAGDEPEEDEVEEFEDEAWELSAQLMEDLSPIVSSASSNWKF